MCLLLPGLLAVPCAHGGEERIVTNADVVTPLSLAGASSTAAPLGDYYAANTWYATANTFNPFLGFYPAGTHISITVSDPRGETFLRLYDFTSGEELAFNRNWPMPASRIYYTVPVDRYLRLAAGCAANLACGGVIVISPGFGRYWANSTANATRNTAWFDLGVFNPGITVQIGTRSDIYLRHASCSAPPGSSTHLVLRDAVTGELLEQNGSFQGGTCSKIIYTLPFTRRLLLQAGCSGDVSCTGVLGISWSFDSMGSLRTDPNSLLQAKPNGFRERAHGVDLRFGSGGKFPENHWYESHFQGFNRIRAGRRGEMSNWALLSASDDADLHAVEMGSKNWWDAGPWGWNYNLSLDRALSDYRCNTEWDHAGGFQQAGNYLFIGIEPNNGDPSHYNDNASEILVFDITRPQHLVELYRIPRATPPDTWHSRGKAGAVGVTRLPNGKYLMSVVQYAGEYIDFYLKDKDPATGYTEIRNNAVAPWRFFKQLAKGSPDFDAPHMSFYDNGNLFTTTDGRIWFIGTLRAFYIEFADVYEVRLSEAENRIQLVRRGTRMFDCSRADAGPPCQFDGAAGVYIDPDSDRLLVYSTEYFGDDVSFSEF